MTKNAAKRVVGNSQNLKSVVTPGPKLGVTTPDQKFLVNRVDSGEWHLVASGWSGSILTTSSPTTPLTARYQVYAGRPPGGDIQHRDLDLELLDLRFPGSTYQKTQTT